MIRDVFELERESNPEPPAKQLKMADRVNEAKLANRNVPFDEKIAKFSSAKIQAFELRDTLNRYRLVGPLAATVLSHCLKPSAFVGFDDNRDADQVWWQSYFKAQPSPTTLNLNNPKPRSVRYAVVRDPRHLLPPKRHCVQPEAECSADSSNETDDIDAIWDSGVRDRVTCDKIPDQKVNEERSKMLVPGSVVDETSGEAKIPVMLINQGGDYGSGWDVVVPAGWGMSFWINFVYRGARGGGQQELRQLCLEQQRFAPLLDAPDSPAGAKEQDREESILKELHLR